MEIIAIFKFIHRLKTDQDGKKNCKIEQEKELLLEEHRRLIMYEVKCIISTKLVEQSTKEESWVNSCR